MKEGVHKVIEELYDSGVNTRIITGDHKDTALFIAREMGIIEKHSEEGAISGDEFSSVVTPMMVLNQIGAEYCYQFKNEDERRNFIQLVRRTTKIIYRANPAQKHMFISALRESGQ